MDSEEPVNLTITPKKAAHFFYDADSLSTDDAYMKHSKIHRKTERASQTRTTLLKFQKKHLSSPSDTVINRIPSPELKNENKSKSDQEHYILDEKLVKQSISNEKLPPNISSSPGVIRFSPKIVYPYFAPSVGVSIPVDGDGTTSSSHGQKPGAPIQHHRNPLLHYSRPPLSHNFMPSYSYFQYSRTPPDFYNPPAPFSRGTALVSPTEMPLQQPGLQPSTCKPDSCFNESKPSVAKNGATFIENYLPSWNERGRSPSPPPDGDSITESMSTKDNSIVSSSIASSSVERYQCDNCGKNYATFKGMTKHQQFHCVTQIKKNFSCKYCGKIYTSLGAFKMHVRTHTLPCKCNVCGKAFSRPWLLQGHIRTHTGQKPFECSHCSRAFADRSNLRAHLQTHSDIKKYSCNACSKTFSRMSLLIKHNDGGCCITSPTQPFFYYNLLPYQIRACLV